MKKYQISSSQHYKLGTVKANTLKEAREQAEEMFPDRKNLHIGTIR